MGLKSREYPSLLSAIAGLKNLFSVDLRSLALFRVGLGTLLLLDCCFRLTDLNAHYTDDGILPRGVYIEKFANSRHVSLFMSNGDAFWPALLFVLGMVIATLLLLGYRSRLMAACGWVLLISAQNRNPMILNGGDGLLRLLFFWAMFLPIGARFAFDQALTTSGSEAFKSRPFKQLHAGGGALAITLQIALLYWSTALLKTGKEWWPEGTASYYALALEHFTTPFGMWLAEQHNLLHWGTYGVFFLELLGPFLLFSPLYFGPLRTLIILAFMGMHFNFDLTMRLGLFPWIDIVGLTVLLPSWFWDRLQRHGAKKRQPVQIYYDDACLFCRKIAYLIHSFFGSAATQVAPAQSQPHMAAHLTAEKSWIVVDSAGQTYFRYAALKTVLIQSPIFGWCFAALPMERLNGIGDKAYRWIARHRQVFGQFTARYLPLRSSDPTKVGIISQLLAVFFIGYVSVWVAQTIPRTKIKMLPAWERLGQYLRLDQKWNMFAPFPLKDDGWYVIPGKLQDGTEIDVFKGSQMGLHPDAYPPVSWEKPALVSAAYKNIRWRKFMMNIWQKSKKDYRLYYGRYLCRQFNRERADGKKLERFNIVFMKENTPPPGVPPKVENVTIWSHECFKSASAQ